ncbi:MAG: type II toxin-antitoxin system VapC family toxin [Deltaproteobacteria bacterium]
MARIFLDANIFLYAIGGEGPYREPARAVLEAVGRGKLDGITSSEVLQEILHVRSRGMNVRDAASAVRAAAGLVADVLPVTQEDVLDACRFLDTYLTLGARDALHAAVMKNAGVSVLVSVDRDFDVLPGLKRLDPNEALALVD